MKKNVASQSIGVQMVSATDGSAFTGSVTVYVTGDAGTQAVGSVGSGACTHEGNGFHTYAPAQAETNYDHIGFTFIGTGAVPSTLQVYTSFPQTQDHTSDITAILADTGELQTDWVNGGRLDLLLDAIKAVTDTQTAISPADFVSLIFDRSLAAHQTALTAGRAITLGGVPIAETTATGTPTTTEIVLAAGSAVDNFYNDQTLKILSGSGAGQARIITSYVGSTRTCTFDEAFSVAPSSGNAVAIEIDHVHPVTEIQAGLATEAKQDAQDLIITEARLAELDAANLPADIAAIPTAAEILTTQMTESYATDGTAPTLAQAMFLIQQSIGDFSITGTTITAYKLDGTTVAATYTLDSSTDPTSRTRST